MDDNQKPVEINVGGTTSPVPTAPKFNKAVFLMAVVALSAVFGFGLNWVFRVIPTEAPFLLFSYAVGLTMIFLPCTLPLAFVIVPLSMGKAPKKGIGIAISFSLGVIVTLSLYGAAIGLLGDALGADRLEIGKNILYATAGILGIFFALGELGFTKFRMPTYSGGGPGFIQRQGDFLKPFLLGLFLGNVGVGCPNPLFNAVILPQIVLEASAFKGFAIMFIHALGRVTPLLILAFLAILGVNATNFLIRHKEKVAAGTAWGMIFVGGFLFMIGVFGHDGYLYSGTHTFLEKLTQEEFITNILGEKIATLGHGHEPPPQGNYLVYAPWAMVILWIIPLWWWYFRNKSQSRAQGRDFGFVAILSLLLIIIFAWTLPHQFKEHTVHEESASAEATIKSTSPISSKEETLFEIDITSKGKLPNPQLFQYNHERLMHVVIIDENFETFAHIHPEDQGVITEDMLKNGEFSFKHVFPKDGRYIVALDFQYNNEEISHKQIFDVGERLPSSLLKDFSSKKVFNGYDFVFLPLSPNIIFGEHQTIKYHVEKNRFGVFDLEPYLGAPAHFAIVSADLSIFDHTHGTLSPEFEGNEHDEHSMSLIKKISAHSGPEEDSRKNSQDNKTVPSKFGPDVYLHHTFDYPGLYAIFGEFKHEGKVILTKFMVEVREGAHGH